eukprot:1153521-Pelagomonas_calceolata.AAC.2
MGLVKHVADATAKPLIPRSKYTGIALFPIASCFDVILSLMKCCQALSKKEWIFAMDKHLALWGLSCKQELAHSKKCTQRDPLQNSFGCACVSFPRRFSSLGSTCLHCIGLQGAISGHNVASALMGAHEDRLALSIIMGRKKKAKRHSEEEESQADWVWIGEPIPRDEVRQRWPNRKTCYDKNPVVPPDYLNAEHATADEENNSYIAKAHYRAVKLQEGSIVSATRKWRIFCACLRTEGIYFNGHYFYKAEETVMANTVIDTRNRRGEVVVKFLSDEKAEGSYKLIEVEQVGRAYVRHIHLRIRGCRNSSRSKHPACHAQRQQQLQQASCLSCSATLRCFP